MTLKRNLFLGLLFVSGGVILLSTYWGLPVELSLLGVIGAGLSLYVAIRYPEWFLVAVVFAPQWKTFWIFRSLGQFGDLTLVVLLGLAASLAWRIILWSGRLGYSEIRSLFPASLARFWRSWCSQGWWPPAIRTRAPRITAAPS